MDNLAIIQAAFKYGPMIKSIIDESMSNHDIVTKIQALSAPLAEILDAVGKAFFPKVSPELTTAAAVMTAFDPDVTKWLQGALNALLDPSPNLVVDGIYGPLTKTGVEKLQAKYGLTIDGWAGQLTQAAIQTALAALTVKKAA